MASVTDGQGGWVIEPEAEERAEGPREAGLGESVEVRPISRVIERHIPSLVVQEDPHSPKGLAQGEKGPRGGEGLVLIPAQF